MTVKESKNPYIRGQRAPRKDLVRRDRKILNRSKLQAELRRAVQFVTLATQENLP